MWVEFTALSRNGIAQGQVEDWHIVRDTIVVFEALDLSTDNLEGDPKCYLVAVDHRMAGPLVEAINEGRTVQGQIEDWQIVGEVYMGGDA